MTPPSWGEASGHVQSRRCAASKKRLFSPIFGRSRGKSSSVASARARSRARRSTRSTTRSSETSRTRRFHARSALGSIALPPSGSSRSAARKTTQRRSRTTISKRSFTHGGSTAQRWASRTGRELLSARRETGAGTQLVCLGRAVLCRGRALCRTAKRPARAAVSARQRPFRAAGTGGEVLERALGRLLERGDASAPPRWR